MGRSIHGLFLMQPTISWLPIGSFVYRLSTLITLLHPLTLRHDTAPYHQQHPHRHQRCPSCSASRTFSSSSYTACCTHAGMTRPSSVFAIPYEHDNNLHREYTLVLASLVTYLSSSDLPFNGFHGFLTRHFGSAARVVATLNQVPCFRHLHTSC